MIRTTLIAAATLATLAFTSPAFAQAGAPVRTLGTPDSGVVTTSERKAAPCTGESCASKPRKRDAYVAAPSFGW